MLYPKGRVGFAPGHAVHPVVVPKHTFEEGNTRTAWIVLFGLAISAGSMAAQSADELVGKYLKAIGGSEKLVAVRTLRMSGKYYGDGGYVTALLQLNRRPNMVREENSTQGLTGVTAYDGTTGWKIDPWGGKKDPEPLEEEELKGIIEDSDFDGPLVNYAEKGNKVEYVGKDQVEGTDAYKLKVTLKNGDVQYFYLDEEYYVPIKIEIERNVRGAFRYYEMYPSEFKEVAGWYLPYSIEGNVKGSQSKWKIVYERIEANLPIEADRFMKPALATAPH